MWFIRTNLSKDQAEQKGNGLEKNQRIKLPSLVCPFLVHLIHLRGLARAGQVIGTGLGSQAGKGQGRACQVLVRNQFRTSLFINIHTYVYLR